MFLQAKNSAELQKRILREKMQDEAAREQDQLDSQKLECITGQL